MTTFVAAMVVIQFLSFCVSGYELYANKGKNGQEARFLNAVFNISIALWGLILLFS